MPEDPKETVLITGANGFVGSRLCRRLLSDGYLVIAGVRRGADMARLEGLDIEYRYGDATKPETLPDMVRGVDYIIHNAGIVKATGPEQFMRVNHLGTKNMLEAAANHRTLRKFIYISSLSAAGPAKRGKPLTEEMPPHPMTVYGRSKAAAEQEILDFKEMVNSVIIRPPAVYGPEDKETFTFFQILSNRVCPYLGNLKRRIQMVHVDDLCYGVSRALGAKTASGSIYFIAESKSYTYYRLIRYLQKAVGRTALPIYLPGWAVRLIAGVSENVMELLGKTPMFTVEKADEILSNWEVSVEKAKEELGFQSQIPFPEGARETVYWYRDQGWL